MGSSFTHRLRSSPLAVVLLLLPLLAACGGAPAAQAPMVAPARPAAAATAAPALTNSYDSSTAAAPAIDAPVQASSDSARSSAEVVGAAATAAPVAESAGGVATTDHVINGNPSAPAPVQQQSWPAIKAGEVDDNADFNSYQQYLYNYSGPAARTADVSERYILTVLNDQQQPVLDARVRIFDNQQLLFVGRTYAGGQTIFLPRALGASSNSTAFRVQIDKGNASAEASLTRGQNATPTFVLPGAPQPERHPRLDVLFLLDATGSMGDEIGRIQQTIVSIADRISALEQQPEVRFGLVSYRDRGDDYVTQVHDFTPNVSDFQQTLLTVRAEGGGDTPESLNEGLYKAIEQVNWADDALRMTFLVADAPPHLDYEQDYDYLQEAQVAVAKGVKIFPIAASNTDDQAEYVFRQLAQQTLGSFIFLTYQPGQNAGAPGDTTQRDVDPAAFTVERLDDLVVQLVRRELTKAVAAA